MIPSILEEELAYLNDKNLYRSLRTLQPCGGMKARWKDKDIFLFCGNDYLGFSRHPRVILAAQQAASQYGVGAGAARLISGTTGLHTELEEKIAAFKGKPKALVYSAGYLANVGVLTALAGEKDVIVMDKLCHASLIDGARLSGAALRIFPHRNYERCEEILSRTEEYERRILVTETVFSMDGDIANFQELVRIKNRYQAILVLDDAHGTGVMGPGGRGGCEDPHLNREVDVVIGTLSKAIGVQGGFAAAAEPYIDYLINRSRPFIFATGISPVLCAAALEAFKLLEEEPAWHQKLWDRVRRVKKILLDYGFDIKATQSPIFPVMIGGEQDALWASEVLLKEGVLIPAIRPPTVAKGKSRLRATVSAAHDEEAMRSFERAMGVLKDALKKKMG